MFSHHSTRVLCDLLGAVAPTALHRKGPLVFLCVSLGVFFYVLSLNGGDLSWLEANFVMLGVYMLLSICFFSTALYAIVTCHFVHPQHRIVALVALVGVLLVLFSLDQGTMPDRHGAYNTIGFLAMAVPLNLISVLLITCHRLAPRPGVFWRGLVGASSVIAVVVYTRLVWYSQIWSDGLDGARLLTDDRRLCKFDSPNLPWMDLLPNGALNFWIDWRRCSSGSRTDWSAELQDGILRIHCPSGSKSFYSIFPDTRPFRLEEKQFGRIHQTVMSQTLKRDYPGQPMVVGSSVSAVLAQCGDDSRLLLQVDPVSDLAERFAAHFAPTAKRPPNVLLLFIDAVSRRHFLRKLKKTPQRLVQLSKSTSLYQFFRYFIVGFCTDRNMRAMFTDNFMQDGSAATLWQRFHESGYVTMRADDGCEDWSAHYEGNISSQFLDHEFIAPFCHPDYYPADGHPFGNLKGPYSLHRRCLFGKLVHEHVFSFFEQFRRTYRSHPWFAVLSLIDAHEGSGENLSTLDDALDSFLASLTPTELDNTAILFLSDHGLHMGLHFMFTQNGHIEHSNPFLYALLPPSITQVEGVASAVKHNEQAIITSFNLFDTFKALIKWPQCAADRSCRSTWQHSIFYPRNYADNCKTANIPDGYCYCH